MTTAIAAASPHPTTFEKHEPQVYERNQTTTSSNQSSNGDVVAAFHYYKDPGDGSLLPPSIVGKPETYERTPETWTATVHSFRGEEDKFTLDGTGFQIYKHVSKEKEFVDDEKIVRVYYPEIEEILKSA